MYKRLLILCPLLFSLACNKSPNNKNKECTDLFAYIRVQFVDKSGNGVGIKDFSVVDLRTNMTLDPAQVPQPCCGYFDIATDSDLQQFTTAGDNLRVSGTDVNTNQTKTAIIKVSGGDNCHVAKVSGPEQIVFD